jgi:hypothetical protein
LDRRNPFGPSSLCLPRAWPISTSALRRHAGPTRQSHYRVRSCPSVRSPLVCRSSMRVTRPLPRCAVGPTGQHVFHLPQRTPNSAGDHAGIVGPLRPTHSPSVDSYDKCGARPRPPLLQPLVHVVAIISVAHRSVREREKGAGAAGDFRPCLRSGLRVRPGACTGNQCSCRSPQFELRTPGVSKISRWSSGSRTTPRPRTTALRFSVRFLPTNSS